VAAAMVVVVQAEQEEEQCLTLSTTTLATGLLRLMPHSQHIGFHRRENRLLDHNSSHRLLRRRRHHNQCHLPLLQTGSQRPSKRYYEALLPLWSTDHHHSARYPFHRRAHRLAVPSTVVCMTRRSRRCITPARRWVTLLAIGSFHEGTSIFVPRPIPRDQEWRKRSQRNQRSVVNLTPADRSEGLTRCRRDGV
jgi:hypothetical protein